MLKLNRANIYFYLNLVCCWKSILIVSLGLTMIIQMMIILNTCFDALICILKFAISSFILSPMFHSVRTVSL